MTEGAIVPLEDLLIRQLRTTLWVWPDFSPMKTFKSKLQLLQPYITDDFNDFAAIVDSIGAIKHFRVSDSAATLEFEDGGGYPHLAVFVNAPGSERWRLQSLSILCPICFGETASNAEPCLLCGGSGWH